MQNKLLSETEQRGMSSKPIKEPKPPAPPQSAYCLFRSDKGPRVEALHPEYDFDDWANALDWLWVDCNPETKSRYEAMAEEDEARYKREETAYLKEIRSSPREWVDEVDPYGDKLPKRSISAFCLFSRNVMATSPLYDFTDVSRVLDRLWADCDPETKSSYEAIAEKDYARYNKEMDAFAHRFLYSSDDFEDEEDEEDEDEY